MRRSNHAHDRQLAFHRAESIRRPWGKGDRLIDLNRTRADLLAEIGVPTSPDATLRLVSDPRVVTGDAVVQLRGHRREQLFPMLEVLLSERMAAAPRLQVLRDLLVPLNHALGNAVKHGNGRESTKAVSVELMLTRTGAVVAVTDEGPGFDVSSVCRRFLAQENYFQYEGAGFRDLHRAQSTVTFENGGRTVLLCYRPSMDAAGEEASPVAGCRHSPGANWEHGPVDTSLDLIEKDSNPLGRESWRIFAARARTGDECAIRALRCLSRGGKTVEGAKIMTGTLHRTKAAALTDFQTSTALCETETYCHLRAPRPMALLAGDPRLVFYDFHPWMSLRQYLDLANWSTRESLQHSVERTGRALAELHRSRMRPDVPDSACVEDRLAGTFNRTTNSLKGLPRGSELASRLDRSIRRIQRQSPPRRQRTLAPIHGSFGWDCIHFGMDKRFYFHRFERFRRDDPGLDLGGYAADLLYFTLGRHDEDGYRLCFEELPDCYNAEAKHPMHRDALPSCIAMAVAERLRRTGNRRNAWAARWLEVLDAVATRV